MQYYQDISINKNELLNWTEMQEERFALMNNNKTIKSIPPFSTTLNILLKLYKKYDMSTY